jgi:general secretion pathway protein G
MRQTSTRYQNRRKARESRKNPAEGGFTLVELLVVMLILTMLAGIIAPRVLGYLGSSRLKTAAVEIKNLATSLELYYLDVGGYPTTADGLNSLIAANGPKRGWNGPYLSKPQAPVDPWGTPYKYESPGKKRAYDIFTLGRDGKPGGEGEDADVWN